MKIFRWRGDTKVAGDKGGLIWSWRTAHLSTTGASHVRNGIECQDQSDSQGFDSGQWAYVIVADGHGSERHFRSGRGSELAVRALSEVFMTFRTYMRELGQAATVADAKTHWSEAARLLVSNWRVKVHVDLVNDPPVIPDKKDGEPGVRRFIEYIAARKGYAHLEQLFLQLRAFEKYAADIRGHPPEALQPLPLTSDPHWDRATLGDWQAKAYGTTVLGVLIGPDALHWLQLGDGAMVKIVGGQADYLAPPPVEAIANETPSLCDDDAIYKIRLGTMPIVSGNFPSAVILTTDGLPNSYEERAGFFDFCQDVAEHANTTSDIGRSLAAWLPEISRRGSGDDMTVAMAWVTEVVTGGEMVTGDAEETDPQPASDDNPLVSGTPAHQQPPSGNDIARTLNPDPGETLAASSTQQDIKDPAAGPAENDEPSSPYSEESDQDAENRRETQ